MFILLNGREVKEQRLSFLIKRVAMPLSKIISNHCSSGAVQYLADHTVVVFTLAAFMTLSVIARAFMLIATTHNKELNAHMLYINHVVCRLQTVIQGDLLCNLRCYIIT